MGWFSKKPSQAALIGTDAGETARAQLFIPINLSNPFTPEGLLEDPYVVGFLMGMVYGLADFATARRGKSFSETEKNEFLMAAIEAIVGHERSAGYVSVVRKSNFSKEYEEGRSSGRALILATYAYPALLEEQKAGRADVVQGALKEIEERRDFVLEVNPDWGDKELLMWAIPEVSINRHLSAKYNL